MERGWWVNQPLLEGGVQTACAVPRDSYWRGRGWWLDRSFGGVACGDPTFVRSLVTIRIVFFTVFTLI